MNKHTATILKFPSSTLAVANQALPTKPVKIERIRHFLVLMAESEASNKNSFFEFLSTFRPKIIFDLRQFPRLDFADGSRRRAFRIFEELSVQYIDVPGRLGISSREDFLALDQDTTPTLRSWVEADPHDDRPIVCLYTDDAVIRQFGKVFRNDIQYYKQRHPETHISQFRAGLLEFQGAATY